MRTTTISAILVLALAQMASAAQTLTVNGEALDAITLKTGQACTVGVVSDNSNPYSAYVGFDDSVVLGSFSHQQTMPEAGDLGAATEYSVPAFYGFFVTAAGSSPSPSAGVHFVFTYNPSTVGVTTLKLYDATLTVLLDSVEITVLESAIGTSITYQGRLMDDNDVADGLYDLRFELYDSPSDGNLIGSAVEANDLDMVDGYFTAELDFEDPEAFNGEGRWLEIGVRSWDSSDPNGYTVLSPRQRIAATPHALGLRGVYVDSDENVGIGTTSPYRRLTIEEGGLSVHTGSSGEDVYFSAGSLVVANSGEDPMLEIEDSPSDQITFSNQGSHVMSIRDQGVTIGYTSSTPPGDGLTVKGNVGIGTASPLYDLHLYDAGNAYVKAESESGYAFFIADGSNNSGFTIKENGTTKANVYWNTANDSLTLYESGGGSVVLKGGNFGIGTDTPNCRLTVTTSESAGRAIFSEATGDDGTGVHGQGEDRGIYGVGWGGTGRGVYGLATDLSGVNFGVYGETWSSDGYAGYFQGKVRVTGYLFKGGGGFQIDHPLEPENKYLQHSFVESPDMMNVYNGNVTLDKNGEAVVKLPDYFDALNRDFRYQLTCIGGFAPVYVSEEISENQFKIGGGKRGIKVSWQVTGIRQDAYAKANRIAVEEDKAVETRGYYLHPEVYGYGKEKRIDAVRNSQVSETRKVAIRTD